MKIVIHEWCGKVLSIFEAALCVNPGARLIDGFFKSIIKLI